MNISRIFRLQAYADKGYCVIQFLCQFQVSRRLQGNSGNFLKGPGSLCKYFVITKSGGFLNL